MPVILAETSDIIFLAGIGAFLLMIGVVIAVMNIVGRRMQDPEIAFEDVPEPIRHVIERLTPVFEARKIFVKLGEKKVPRKYELHGDLNGNATVIEVKPRSTPPYIKEIEVIYEPSYRRLENGELIELSSVPATVMEAAIEHMDSIRSAIDQVDQARIGTIFDEPAYELKGSWTHGRFEMKILATGAVVKVELRLPKK